MEGLRGEASGAAGITPEDVVPLSARPALVVTGSVGVSQPVHLSPFTGDNRHGTVRSGSRIDGRHGTNQEAR